MYVELETTTAPGQPTLQMLIVVGCVCCKKGRTRLGLITVREMARHRLRRIPYIGVPRALVQDRMQLFRLRDIERGGGAVVAARDFYAFQQQRGAWGRDDAA